MKKDSLIYFMVFFFFVCLLHGFQKQEKAKKPLEHEVLVELVVVEVFVTDKDGNFVDNLTEDDFEIYEDGKKVEIYYFDIVSLKKETIKEEFEEKVIEAKKPLPPQKMKLVILFDNFNTNKVYLNHQWSQIEDMFRALSDKVEETMIMELNRESGMRVIQPFTSDPDLLASKISSLRFDLWKDIEEEIRKREMEDLEIEARLAIEDRFILNPEYIMKCLNEEERHIRRIRLADSFSSFLAAVNYIRQYDGVKSVLIISDGFHLERDIKIGYTFDTDYKKDFVRIFDPFKLFGGKRYFDQQEAFEKFLRLINEEKIVFYACSPKGLREEFSVRDRFYRMFRDEMEQWSKERGTLEEIADETGGMYLKGEKKYENFIKELGRDLTHFYDISYIPPKREKRGGYHKIDVKMKKSGVTARCRKGYSDFTDEDLERKNLAAAFLSPSLYKDITFSCKTDFIFLRSGYPQFWIRVKIPLDQFKNNQDVMPPEELALLFGINEWSEDRVHTGGRMFQVKEAIGKGLDTLYRAFITSLVNIKPGKYETRIILRQEGNQIGGWEDSLDIPDVRKGSHINLVNAVLGSLRQEEKENTVPFSVSIGDGALLLSRYRMYPFLENVFTKEGEVAVFLQIHTPAEMQNLGLHFSIESDENEAIDLPSEKVESFYDEESKIVNEVYLLDFRNITPGDYQLKTASSDGRVERRIDIKIIP